MKLFRVSNGEQRAFCGLGVTLPRIYEPHIWKLNRWPEIQIKCLRLVFSSNYDVMITNANLVKHSVGGIKIGRRRLFEQHSFWLEEIEEENDKDQRALVEWRLERPRAKIWLPASCLFHLSKRQRGRIAALALLNSGESLVGKVAKVWYEIFWDGQYIRCSQTADDPRPKVRTYTY